MNHSWCHKIKAFTVAFPQVNGDGQRTYSLVYCQMVSSDRLAVTSAFQILHHCYCVKLKGDGVEKQSWIGQWPLLNLLLCLLNVMLCYGFSISIGGFVLLNGNYGNHHWIMVCEIQCDLLWQSVWGYNNNVRHSEGKW